MKRIPKRLEYQGTLKMREACSVNQMFKIVSFRKNRETYKAGFTYDQEFSEANDIHARLIQVGELTSPRY